MIGPVYGSEEGTLGVVLAREFGSSSTCQYPDARSSVVKYFACPNVSSMSSTRGRGYTSFLVIVFKWQ